MTIWRLRFCREPILLLPWDLFSSLLNKSSPTSLAEIKGIVWPLLHQAGDGSSPSISRTNFKLATGDFLPILNGTADSVCPTTAISDLLFSSMTEKKEKLKLKDLKYEQPQGKENSCTALEL